LKGWLGKKRITEISECDNFVCHKNNDLQCGGHMILLGDNNVFVRMAKALGLKLVLKGRELVFDNVRELIKHHSNGF
jgi:hypothetical protein